MKAFTIATDEVFPMAEECKRRVARFCGVRSFDIHHAENRHHAYVSKLKVWLEYSEPIWFVDADMWMIRRAWLPEIHGPAIIGAPADCPDMSIARPEDFQIKMLLCSSLIGMDMSNPDCRAVVQEAVRLQEARFPGGKAKYDGWFLNLAAQRCQDFMICRLGNDWNWCDEHPSATARNIHAASRPNKMEWLTANTTPLKMP